MARRLLTISHSYVVALNRRLAQELGRVGRGDWDVTALAPSSFRGDLRALTFEAGSDDSLRVELSRVRLPGSLHAFTYDKRLREVLSQGWDLVHAWEEPYVLAGAQIAALTPAGTPLVFSTYQNLSKKYPPPFAQLERYSMHRARGWIAGGEIVRSALGTRRGYRSRPARVIPMGVDTTMFRSQPVERIRTRKALGWGAEGAPVVGYLGRFVEEKGVTLLTRALDRTRCDWRALIVGGGPLESFLRSWGERYAGRVKVVTGVPHEGVPAYLNAMDLLCAPSQTLDRWKEQFGRMIVEAFACGVPVIASDSGEIPHTMADAGRIVGERDEVEWAKVIEALAVDVQLRAALGERGRRRAEEKFAWPNVARETLGFFEEILDVTLRKEASSRGDRRSA